ncbi:MAG: OmpH family outer membrane protein [Prevotella sp.]|nr:OmpH family outer membrane protein [Prevotella sp.]
MKKLVLMLMLFAPTAMFAQKFGHVDTQAIMQSLPEISTINGELEAKAKQYENELQDMQKELQRKSQDLDGKRSTMNATKIQEAEAELQTLYQKITETYQANQQELQKLQQEKMQPVIEKVRRAIETVGKEGGYTYIFENTVPIYTGSGSKDVTDDVKAKLK